MQMVFSSSCTVYGNPSKVPIDETHPLSAVSPYGRTKLIIEDIFRDYAEADKSWRTILLRYFNPVGAHPSGDAGISRMTTCPDSRLLLAHSTHPCQIKQSLSVLAMLPKAMSVCHAWHQMACLPRPPALVSLL